MVRILITILGAALAAPAAVTLSTDQLTPVSFRTKGTITAAGSIRAVYEPKSGTCRSAQQLAYASMSVWRGDAGEVHRTVAGLKPSTAYCVAVWNQNTNEFSPVLEVTTPALTAERPQAPVPVNDWAVGPMPVINGNTYTVAANCSDLQAKLDAAAAVAGSANHQILIPPGTVCTADYYFFPPRTGTGWIVVRTAAPDSQLPPEGVRLTPAWSARLATLEVKAKAFGNGAHAAVRMTDTTRKWRLVGLEITHRADCANCKNIASVGTGSPTTIVTTAPHGLATGALMRAFGVNGISGLERTARVTVVNGTTFTVPASTTGSYGGGGRLISTTTSDQDYKTLAYVSHGSEDIVFDRCWVHGRGFPDRIYYGMLIQGRRVSVINSTVERVRNWHLAEPGTNNVQFGSYATNLLIDFTDAKQIKIENCYLEPIGVGLFSQDSNTRTTEDVILRRNHIVIPDQIRYRSDGANPASDGHYYIHRMPFEIKQAKRIAVEGNLFEGQYMDASPPGPSVLLYMRGSLQSGDGPNSIEDARISDNEFRKASGAIQLVGEDDIAAHGSLAMRRILIQNNLIHGINAKTYRTTVSGSSADRGFCFWLMRSIHELKVDHNTCIDPRGSGPMTFLFGHNRSGYLELSNNILTWNTEGPLGGFFYDDNGAAPLPAPEQGTATSATFRTLMNANWQQTPEPAWKMHDNVIIPGVRSMAASIDSTDTGMQWNRYSLCHSSNGVFKDVLAFRNVCAGTNNSNNGSETVRKRMDAMKFFRWESGDFRLRPDSPYGAAGQFRAADGKDMGADVERILERRGAVRETRIREVGPSSAVLSYQAPDATACTVEYGTSAVPGTGARVTDGGGAKARNVTLGSLSAGTAYHYRILCASEQPAGSFRTP